MLSYDHVIVILSFSDTGTWREIMVWEIWQGYWALHQNIQNYQTLRLFERIEVDLELSIPFNQESSSFN